MTDRRDIVRCPVCGAGLTRAAGADWCPRCALAAAFDAGGDESVLFTVPGHAVLAELGRGAAGIVYRARQEKPAREVALKILRPHEVGSAESLARFRLEAATVAALDHPVILPVFSVGEHDGLPYFTMKLCRGSLAERSGPYRDARAAAELVAVLAEAVQHAHARGVLHRDLKPGNVLFDEADRPFVSDFGLAKLIETSAGGAPATRPLLVMGTPGYMAPEVLAGGAGAATTAADVFALGAILHELLTGQPPPAATAAMAPRPGVPRDLAVICTRALAAEPGQRYHSAEALAADLRAWLAGRPIAARPVSAFGQTWSWARRNPAVAILSAAFGLALAGSAVVFAVKNRELRAALAATQAAEARSQASLAESLVAQARAVRQSGREGQRREALALLRRAAAIRPTPEMREEAVAALLLPDWEKDERANVWSGNTNAVAPLPDFSGILVEDFSAKFSLMSVDGATRWTWTAPAPSASLPVFSPDGRWVALHLRDDTVQVLAVADGRKLFQLAGRPYAFKDSVWFFGHDLDFSPDGKFLVAPRPEGGVTIHALPGGEPAGEWVAPEWITTVHCAPDGARVALGGSRDKKNAVLAVLALPAGGVIAREKMSGRVEFIAWSGDGRTLASRPAGGATEVRRAVDLALRATIPDKDALHGIFLPDGDRLLLTKQIQETRLWDITRGKLLLAKEDWGRPGNWWRRGALEQWRSSMAGPVVRQKFVDSPVWQARGSGETDYTIKEIGWPLDRSPDGELLAIGGWGGGAILRADTGERVGRVMLSDGSDGGMLRLDPAGDAVWVSLAQKGLSRVPLVRAAGGALSLGTPEVVDDEKNFFLTARNDHGHRLALVNEELGEVKVIDTRTRRTVARWKHRGAAMAEFSPDGAHLVVNGDFNQKSANQPATIYAAATGAVERTLGEKPGRTARWSPGGAWVLVSESNAAQLWRTSDWSPGPKLPPQAFSDWSPVAFSADDRTLVGWSGDDFQIVEVATGRLRMKLPQPGGTGFVLDVAVDGDRRFWSVNLDGQLQLWDLTALQRELNGLGLGVVGDR